MPSPGRQIFFRPRTGIGLRHDFDFPAMTWERPFAAATWDHFERTSGSRKVVLADKWGMGRCGECFIHYLFYGFCGGRPRTEDFSARHGGGGNICFLDGRVEYFKFEDIHPNLPPGIIW